MNISIGRTVACATLALWIPAAAAAVDPAAQAEYERAFAATYKAPADLDLALRYAEAATKVGDYEGAIGALERILIYNPDLPRIRLELGALYLRLRSFDAARGYLDSVTATDLPPDQRQRVQAMLAEIEGGVSGSRLAGALQAGLRYQSNVGSATTSGVIRAYGLDSTLDRQFAKRADSNAFLSGGVSHQYDFGLSGMQWESNAVGYATQQFTVTKFDLLLAEVDTGPRFALFGNGADAVSARPYLLGGAVGLNDSVYYTSLGSGLSLLVPLAPAVAIDLAGEARHREFHASSVFSSAGDKTGWLYSSRARVRYAAAPEHQLAMGIVASRDDAEDAAEANKEVALVAEHQWTLASLAVAERPPRLITSLQRTWRNYDEADSVVDPSVVRKDRQWLLSATFTLPIAPSWSTVIQLQHDWTDSNLVNYRYRNASGMLGVSYAF